MSKSTKPTCTAREHFIELVRHTDDLFAGLITDAEHARRNGVTWRAIERDGLADEVCACWREWQRTGTPAAIALEAVLNSPTA